MMKAVTEKWPIVRDVARKLGYREDRIAKWKQRGVAPAEIIPLIIASKGKLVVADFVEPKQDAEQG